MIKSFKHKDLRGLFLTGHSSKVAPALQKRILRRLDSLDLAEETKDLDIPGFNFHGLMGNPKRYSIHVNGPWCLTFEWHEKNIYAVDMEQYH
ncbi:MAG: type II toxin-antitoxin system RelE/ParE family toxin [Alphaproteobacteria bacterium]|nr:type II toxin-antitoxin system RelE/ParE family toxin [Alphaproteobacteria bacterium]